MLGFFRLISATDSAMISAWRTGAWSRWIGIWLVTTICLAAGSFLIIFLPGIIWETGMHAYDVGMHHATLSAINVTELFRFSEIEGGLIGAINIVGAPLIMVIQTIMGDFRAQPKQEIHPPFVGD